MSRLEQLAFIVAKNLNIKVGAIKKYFLYTYHKLLIGLSNIKN